MIIKIGIKDVLPADLISMGFYLLSWGIFTLFMTIATISHNTITKLVFGSLTILSFTLAIGDFIGIVLLTKFAGGIGIITGLFAIYSAVGQIVNSELNKEVLPL